MVQTAGTGFRSLRDFVTRINNDWVLGFASGIAYSLLVAIIPITIALIALVGFIYGGLNPNLQQEFIKQIQHVFPEPIPSAEIVGLALDALNTNAGLLGIIAILLAIFAGSGLFVSMEGYFDIIYRRPPRDLVPQYLMAIGMIFLFGALAPLIVAAGSLPALIDSMLLETPLSQISDTDFLLNLSSFLCGLFVAWVLMEAIYLIVPNQYISFRNSWLGALLAATALQIYLTLFPFYVTHFLSGYTGVIGLTVITMFFFYYFAVILLVGAEVNAFFAQGIPPLPENPARLIHQLTKAAPHSEKNTREQSP